MISAAIRVVRILPDLIRQTAAFARWNFGDLLSPETTEDCGHDHSSDEEPLLPWEAGRLALEITTLIRSHRDFPKGHHEAMQRVIDDLDSPQHSVDVVLALASMFSHVVSDEDIVMFREGLMDAEARS